MSETASGEDNEAVSTTITIEIVTREDLPAVRELIDTCVVGIFTRETDPTVADPAYAEVVASLEGGNQVYLLAKDGDEVIGMMGFVIHRLDDAILPYVDSPSSTVEFHHVYIHPDARGKKVLARIAKFGLEGGIPLPTGITQIVLRSGFMFSRSGWPVWTHIFGEPVATLADYYKPADQPSHRMWNAQVWVGSIDSFLGRYAALQV